MQTYTVTLQTGPASFETVTVTADSSQAAWAAAMAQVDGVVTAVNWQELK